jgi:hypothetical protein
MSREKVAVAEGLVRDVAARTKPARMRLAACAVASVRMLLHLPAGCWVNPAAHPLYPAPVRVLAPARWRGSAICLPAAKTAAQFAAADLSLVGGVLASLAVLTGGASSQVFPSSCRV